jgi:hypothetical protein
MLTALWFFYMAFEAYHTARKKQLGEPIDEFSSIIPLKNQAGSPLGALVLIGIGLIFLLNTMEIVRLGQILRYWPLFLIGLGVYLLYARVSPGGTAPPSTPGFTVSDPVREVPRER